MDNERLDRIRKMMETERLDAIVCRLPENVLFLSGHWPLIGWSFLVFPLDGKPVCIVPHCDEKEAGEELWDAERVSFSFGVLASGNPFDDIGRALKKIARGKNWRRIGFEGGFEAIAPSWNAAEVAVPAQATRSVLEGVFGSGKLVDVTGLLNSQRATKTSMEAEKIRIANEISTFGLKTFCEKVSPGISGVELVAEVERSIMIQGTGYRNVGRVRAFAQVSTGATETAAGFRPMEISTARKLVSGDIAILELGVVADGFWSDRTHTRVAGKPDQRHSKVFETVKAAQEAAIGKIRPGIKAGEVDEAARSIVRKAGFEKEFFHVTGHGIGLRYHEPVPLVCPGSDLVLESGMVHTVEPGIYFAGFGGMRIEDDVLVTDTGSEVLGPFKKELN